MDPIIGQIQLFAISFAPRGWTNCEGQMLSIPQNQALFAVLNNTYGGNGTTTFALPDLRDTIPLPGMRYCIAVEGIYPAQP